MFRSGPYHTFGKSARKSFPLLGPLVLKRNGLLYPSSIPFMMSFDIHSWCLYNTIKCYQRQVKTDLNSQKGLRTIQLIILYFLFFFFTFLHIAVTVEREP